MPTNFYKGRMLDARPDRLDLRDREYRPPLKSLPALWPPRDILNQLLPCYRENQMILDQEREGACTGFGLAAVINYLLWREVVDISGGTVSCAKNIRNHKVSPRMLYNVARIYDEWEGEDYEGSSCRGAMKGWHRHGVCRDATWPYTSEDTRAPKPIWREEAVLNPLGAYYRINKDSVSDMQAAIHEVGAIYCSADIHDGWWDPGKGDGAPPILQHDGKNRGGHAFALVGYTPDGFLVQNSWGEDWGHHGFAVLSYADWVENGTDAWVAVRGAPIRASSPRTYAHHPLQAVAVEETARVGSFISRALGYRYHDDLVRPLSVAQAYEHALVLGNDGRPVRTFIDSPDADATAVEVCQRNIQRWLQRADPGAQVAIYAHGGLTTREASINRIRVMAPYFLANGVYPLFVTWQTGLFETISHQVDDIWNSLLARFGLGAGGARARGLFEKFQDPIDQAIEKAARNSVRGLWTEMKENALRASDRAVPGFPQRGPNARAGGMALLASAITALRQDFDFDIHMVGHSAGAILLGRWLDELQKRELSAKTATLLAPACTTRFANRHFARAVKNQALAENGLHVYLLDDERERADRVGIYGKSVLYLVSRALEDIHKMPLLGLAASWHDEGLEKDGLFNTAQHTEIRKWQAFAKDHVELSEYGRARSQVATSRKGDRIDLSHTSFDNDILVISQTIARIAGMDELEHRVENLGWF